MPAYRVCASSKERSATGAHNLAPLLDHSVVAMNGTALRALRFLADTMPKKERACLMAAISSIKRSRSRAPKALRARLVAHDEQEHEVADVDAGAALDVLVEQEHEDAIEDEDASAAIAALAAHEHENAIEDDASAAIDVLAAQEHEDASPAIVEQEHEGAEKEDAVDGAAAGFNGPSSYEDSDSEAAEDADADAESTARAERRSLARGFRCQIARDDEADAGDDRSLLGNSVVDMVRKGVVNSRTPCNDDTTLVHFCVLVMQALASSVELSHKLGRVSTLELRKRLVRVLLLAKIGALSLNRKTSHRIVCELSPSRYGYVGDTKVPIKFRWNFLVMRNNVHMYESELALLVRLAPSLRADVGWMAGHLRSDNVRKEPRHLSLLQNGTFDAIVQASHAIALTGNGPWWKRLASVEEQDARRMLSPRFVSASEHQLMPQTAHAAAQEDEDEVAAAAAAAFSEDEDAPAAAAFSEDEDAAAHTAEDEVSAAAAKDDVAAADSSSSSSSEDESCSSSDADDSVGAADASDKLHGDSESVSGSCRAQDKLHSVSYHDDDSDSSYDSEESMVNDGSAFERVSRKRHVNATYHTACSRARAELQAAKRALEQSRPRASAAASESVGIVQSRIKDCLTDLLRAGAGGLEAATREVMTLMNESASSRNERFEVRKDR